MRGRNQLILCDAELFAVLKVGISERILNYSDFEVTGVDRTGSEATTTITIESNDDDE